MFFFFCVVFFCVVLRSPRFVAFFGFRVQEYTVV